MFLKIIVCFFILFDLLSCQSNISHNSTSKQDSINKKQHQEDSLDAEAMHDLAPAVGILPK